MHQFLKFVLEWNSTCFGQSLCPSSGVFHCTHSNGICHTGLLTACEQEYLLPSVHHQEFFAVHTAIVYVIQVSWQLVSRSKCSCSQAVSKPVWHIPLLCVQWITPYDGQRNCPKHAEFHSKINLRNWSIWLVLLKRKLQLLWNYNNLERQL